MLHKQRIIKVLTLFLLFAGMYMTGYTEDRQRQPLENQTASQSEFTITKFTTDCFFTSEDHAFDHSCKPGALFSVMLDGKKIGTAQIIGVNGSTTSFRVVSGRLNMCKKAHYSLVFEKTPPAPRMSPPVSNPGPSRSAPEKNRLELPRLEIVHTEFCVTGINTVKTKVTIINRSPYTVYGIVAGCRITAARNAQFGKSYKYTDSLPPGGTKTIELPSSIPGHIQAIVNGGSSLSVMLDGEQVSMQVEAFIQNACVNGKDTWSWWPWLISTARVYCAGNRTIPTSSINAYSEIPAFEIDTVNKPNKEWKCPPVNVIMGKIMEEREESTKEQKEQKEQ